MLIIPKSLSSLEFPSLVLNSILDCLLNNLTMFHTHLSILCAPIPVNCICSPPSTSVHTDTQSTCSHPCPLPPISSQRTRVNTKSDHDPPVIFKPHPRFSVLLAITVLVTGPTYFSALIFYYLLCSDHNHFLDISRRLQAYHSCIRSGSSSLCSTVMMMVFSTFVLLSVCVLTRSAPQRLEFMFYVHCIPLAGTHTCSMEKLPINPLTY